MDRRVWISICEVNLTVMLWTGVTSLDLSKLFILQTDGSNQEVGALLSQLDGDGTNHLVGYFSRKLLIVKGGSLLHSGEWMPHHKARNWRIQGIHSWKTISDPYWPSCSHMVRSTQREQSNTHSLELSFQPYSFLVKHCKNQMNKNTNALSQCAPN